MDSSSGDSKAGQFFSINIPVYNEEEIIVQNTQKLIQFLTNLGLHYEVIIVSNGSTDGTIVKGKVLEQMYPQVCFFHIPQKGVGKAFRLAAERASSPYLISMDMDLAVELEFIPKALKLLNDYTIVLGSKILGTQKRSLIRRIGGGMYILVSKALLGLKFHDYSIGGKAYNRNFVLEHMDRIDDETNYVINLTYHAVKRGYNVIEIPVKCVDTRKSRFNLLREAIYRYSMLLKMILLK